MNHSEVVMNSVLLLATILLSVDAAVPASAPAAVYSAPAVVSAATDAGVPASDAVVASVSDAQVITVTPSAAPASAAASVPAEPATVEQAVGQVTVLVDLFKAGKWLAFALVLVQLLMFAVKKYTSDEFKKAWGFVVVTGLGGVIALLSAVVAGGTWIEALFVFASGPVSALVYDLIRAVKPKKA